MNDIFDIKRFCSYFAHTLRYERTLLLLGSLSIFGAWFVMMLLPAAFNNDLSYSGYSGDLYYDPMWDSITTELGICSFLFLSIAASMMFSNLAKKEGRITSLMLPASHLEKYIARWIIFVPLAFVVFLGTFEVADLLRCLIIKMRYPQAVCVYPFFSSANTSFFHSSFFSSEVYSFLILLPALYSLGSIIWPKSSVTKTTVALMIIVCVYSMYSMWLGRVLFDPGLYYGWSGMDEGGPDHVLLTINVILSLVCWIIAYFRFKEIEIIQRW